MRHSWLVLATRYSWLALATLLVCAGEADAKRISCACPATITLPERGATGVPENAKRWTLGSYGAIHYSSHVPAAEIMGVETAELVPGDVTSSGQRDDTPPAAPADVHVSLTTVVRPDPWNVTIDSLTAFGRFAADTALVRIDIRDQWGTVSLLTTPHRLYLCEPGFFVLDGKLTVEVRSIDLAGNESEPFVAQIEVTAATESESSCRAPSATGAHHSGNDEYDHYRHRGHGFEILFVLLAFPLGLIAWLIVVIVRRASVNRELAEELSLLAAEAVVRRLIRWQLVWSAMLVVTTIAVTTGIDDQYWIFLVPWLFSSFGQLLLQRRALRLLDRPEVDAARRGRWLVVTSLKSSVTVRASDIDFVVAKQRAIPTSVMQ